MILAISLTTLLLSQTPQVELDFSSMGAGDWKGKRFNEIVPAHAIKRVIRVTESGFARDFGRSGAQADYDALMARLLNSPSAARDWVVADNEGRLADLLVITRDGEVFCIGVIGIHGTPSSPTGIIVHGKGHGARFDVKDFKHPDGKS